MATVDILGVPHAYDLTAPKAPSSPVLVFIHGWLLSRRYWRPLMDKLASDYQCLAYDLRGFGDSQANTSYGYKSSGISLLTLGSDWAEDSFSTSNIMADSPQQITCASNLSRYTPSAYAEDLERLLQAMKIDRAWLIGHSLGGTIALWGAAQMPERVRGVICLNAGGGIYLKEAFERFRGAGAQLVKMRYPWLGCLPGIDLLLARMNVAHPLARHWGRQRLWDFLAAEPEAALGALLDSTTEEEVNFLPRLVAKLQQPAYFIAGEQDRVMEPKYVRYLGSFHRLFQAGEDNAIEIPNCGHLAMLEQTDLLAAHIRDILAGSGE